MIHIRLSFWVIVGIVGFIINGQPSISVAQKLTVLPNEKSLSLTIWGAGLKMNNDMGAPWDRQSPPDGLVRVYLGGKLLGESSVKRDQLQPLWALTVGPIPERRFFEGALMVEVVDQDVLGEESIEDIIIPIPADKDLAKVLKLEGKNLKPLIYQWVVVRADLDQETRSFRFKESTLAPRPAKDPQKKQDISVKSTAQDEQKLKKEQQKTARMASKAASLYRAYLKAQFNGDQIQEHQILIKLALLYSHTRHGRKAKRILLLDGR